MDCTSTGLTWHSTRFFSVFWRTLSCRESKRTCYRISRWPVTTMSSHSPVTTIASTWTINVCPENIPSLFEHSVIQYLPYSSYITSTENVWSDSLKNECSPEFHCCLYSMQTTQSKLSERSHHVRPRLFISIKLNQMAACVYFDQLDWLS